MLPLPPAAELEALLEGATEEALEHLPLVSLLHRLLVDVEVDDVQADEIWGYVSMKERTKKMQGLDDPQLGDAYTFVAIERESKLVLAHHLGQRSYNDAVTPAMKAGVASSIWGIGELLDA